MGRRRKREPDVIGGIALLVGMLVMLGFFASLGGQNLFGGLLQGFFALITLAFWGLLIVLVVGVMIFFIVKALTANRQRPAYYERPVGTPSQRFAADGQILVPPEPITFSEPSPPTARDVITLLCATDWYQFEKVVGLIYQSQGYRPSRRGGQNPDGGIDLIVEKNGERAAVQCKRWKKWEVKEPLIREFLGAMTHEGISKGIVVALNGFTLPAKQLAIQHNIDIIHDENLGVMIAGLAPEDQRKVVAMLNDETKHCPKCEATMIWRTPKPGKNWTPFWGCSRYPQCHGRLQDD
jgi:hypothetical protein